MLQGPVDGCKPICPGGTRFIVSRRLSTSERETMNQIALPSRQSALP